jgi:N-acetylated-alpha-linked acidic dipeptidase
MFTGYGVKTLPGVREGIEQDLWQQAEQYVLKTAHALDQYCDRLQQATELLTRS